MNFSTTMPIDLDQASYVQIALEGERPSIGCALPDVEVEVRDANGAALEFEHPRSFLVFASQGSDVGDPMLPFGAELSKQRRAAA